MTNTPMPTATDAPAAAPSTDVLERVEERVVTDDGDHERFAHIIRKDDQMRAYVLGEPVTALCGKTWVPARDPERYPVCPTCKEVLASLRGGGS
jgi:hypothetical protein